MRRLDDVDDRAGDWRRQQPCSDRSRVRGARCTSTDAAVHEGKRLIRLPHGSKAPRVLTGTPMRCLAAAFTRQAWRWLAHTGRGATVSSLRQALGTTHTARRTAQAQERWNDRKRVIDNAALPFRCRGMAAGLGSGIRICGQAAPRVRPPGCLRLVGSGGHPGGQLHSAFGLFPEDIAAFGPP